MRNSLIGLVPYDEATLFDLVQYDNDQATRSDELPDAALEMRRANVGKSQIHLRLHFAQY